MALSPFSSSFRGLLKKFAYDHYSTLSFTGHIDFLTKQRRAIRRGDRGIHWCLLLCKALKYTFALFLTLRSLVIGCVHANSTTDQQKLLPSYLSYIDPLSGIILRRYHFFQFPYALCVFAVQPLFFLYVDHMMTFQLSDRLLTLIHQAVVLNGRAFFRLNYPLFGQTADFSRIFRRSTCSPFQLLRRFWFDCPSARFSLPRIEHWPPVDDQSRVRLVLVTLLLDCCSIFSLLLGGKLIVEITCFATKNHCKSALHWHCSHLSASQLLRHFCAGPFHQLPTALVRTGLCSG